MQSIVVGHLLLWWQGRVCIAVQVTVEVNAARAALAPGYSARPVHVPPGAVRIPLGEWRGPARLRRQDGGVWWGQGGPVV